MRDKTFQAKHIDDANVLTVVRLLCKRSGFTAGRWDIVDAFKPVPWKIINAKLTSMKKRGLVDGCAGCTCHGAFKVRKRAEEIR